MGARSSDGVAARVEYKFFGNWISYSDFSARQNRDGLLVVGAGGDWSQSGDADLMTGAIDAQWESQNGLGAFAALLLQNIEPGGDQWAHRIVREGIGGIVQPSGAHAGEFARPGKERALHLIGVVKHPGPFGCVPHQQMWRPFAPRASHCCAASSAAHN